MINAVILNRNQEANALLQQEISNCCPQLKVTSSTFSPGNYLQVFQKKTPKLVFLDIEEGLSMYTELFQNLGNYAFEIILIASRRDFAFEAINHKISGYLLKPICSDSLKTTVDSAIKRVLKKKNAAQNNVASQSFQLGRIIGIPTMEGYEFLNIAEIIRCESYLKCTRVITKERSDVISSYNIGEFIKALAKHGFYAPHQSHIINLCKVKKYLNEGTIIMQDNSAVPVARRRKNDFLSRIPHI